MAKEMKVGEIRTLNGTPYKCVPGHHPGAGGICDGCPGNHGHDTCDMAILHFGECTQRDREDGQDVKFIKAEDGNDD